MDGRGPDSVVIQMAGEFVGGVLHAREHQHHVEFRILQQMQQQLQAAAQEIKSRSDIEAMKEGAESHRLSIKEEGATRRALIQQATKESDMKLRTDTTAHDTIVKTETQKMIEGMRARAQESIEQIKGEFALILASIDRESARAASDETTERAI